MSDAETNEHVSIRMRDLSGQGADPEVQGTWNRLVSEVRRERKEGIPNEDDPDGIKKKITEGEQEFARTIADGGVRCIRKSQDIWRNVTQLRARLSEIEHGEHCVTS